jgi:hypothetical protein
MLNAAVEVGKEELREAVVVAGDLEVFDGAPKSPLEETKKPRKFVKDEHHETGGVMWSIYIRASPRLGYATKDQKFSPDSSVEAKLHSHHICSPSSPPTDARRAKSLSSMNSYKPPFSADLYLPISTSFLPHPLPSATIRFLPFRFPPTQRRLLALHNGRAASRAPFCVWREQ